jgi:hypothetical protein
MLFIFLVLFSSAPSLWGQHSEQPAKESSTDLRNQTILFSIELVSAGKTYLLERSLNMDYSLRLKTKGNQDAVLKISGKEGQRLDREFAARFLRVQYEIAQEPGKCHLTHRLALKDERQEICAKDEKKSQEFALLLAELGGRF